MIADPIGDAVRWLREGGLLAYPTETVWGLGADATSDPAMALLRRWKGRDEGVPISILVGAAESLAGLGFEPDGDAGRLASEFWPGPLTLVLPCRGRFARGIARPDGAVGVRCSAHPLAAALARRVAAEGIGPITATSLNASGAPPARTRDEARALCDGATDAPRLLDVEGAEAGGDEESTVVDLTGERPRVLRQGALPVRALGRVLQEIA